MVLGRGDVVDEQPQNLTDEEQEAVEFWFVRRGLPNLIDDYSLSTDVFNRAVPFLAVLWAFNILGAYGDRFKGWSQAFAAIGASVILIGVAILINLVRGRPALRVPERVGLVEIAVFVLTPAVLPLVLQTGGIKAFAVGLTIGLVELLVVWFTYGFGLGSILRWAVVHLFRQLRSVFALMIRSLPLLLVFTMFLFLNAELWQVASDFTTQLFWVATGGLVLVALGFVIFRIPAELEELCSFDSPEEANSLLKQSDAPISGRIKDPALTPELSTVDRVNVTILAIFSIGVQIGLVMVIVGLFYLFFGLVTVRPETIAQWTASGGVEEFYPLELFGSDIPLTTELMKVTGFLMAFTALQFTVSALTDATYRKEFLDDLTGDISEALAVRALYLERLKPPDD